MLRLKIRAGELMQPFIIQPEATSFTSSLWLKSEALFPQPPQGYEPDQGAVSFHKIVSQGSFLDHCTVFLINRSYVGELVGPPPSPSNSSLSSSFSSSSSATPCSSLSLLPSEEDGRSFPIPKLSHVVDHSDVSCLIWGVPWLTWALLNYCFLGQSHRQCLDNTRDHREVRKILNSHVVYR